MNLRLRIVVTGEATKYLNMSFVGRSSDRFNLVSLTQILNFADQSATARLLMGPVQLATSWRSPKFWFSLELEVSSIENLKVLLDC